MLDRTRRLVTSGVVMLALGGIAAVVIATGFDVVRSRAAAAVYRARLEALSQQHAQLIDHYNTAVRRTAVTELVVREPGTPTPDAVPASAIRPDGTIDPDVTMPPPEADRPSLSVRVRSVEGVEREVLTEYDPRREIYVDFVVIDGRVWIRRLFDERTPPAQGLVLDPAYRNVDWSADGATVGKAAYRSLDVGRWVVTVTGSGTIDLDRAGPPDDLPSPLAASVAIERFEEIESKARAAEEAVGFRDVIGWIFGSGSADDAETTEDAPEG